MALIMFSCRATGPFIIFEETLQQIFKEIGEPWHDQGAWDKEMLPNVLERLDEAYRLDREKFLRQQAERDEELRRATFDEEERIEEDERIKARKDAVHLFQRMQPLRDMIARALRHDETVMWGAMR